MALQNTLLPSGNMDEFFGDLSKVFPEVRTNDGDITNYGSPILNMINRSSSSADSTSPESYSDIFQSRPSSYNRTALYERTQLLVRRELERIPPHERMQNERTLLQNIPRMFDEPTQFNMSPPSENTLSYQQTPFDRFPVRGQYERTPLQERVLRNEITPPYERTSQNEWMEVDRISQFRKTPPHESVSQFEKSPSHGTFLQEENFTLNNRKTSQVGNSPLYERISQLEKTPPIQRTSQYEIILPYERATQLEKTPQYQRNSQFERSPSYESTSQLGTTFQLGRILQYQTQFDRTMLNDKTLHPEAPLPKIYFNENTLQFERTSQVGRTPLYESTAQFGRNLPLERTPKYESTSQYDRKLPYETSLQFERSSLQSSSNESTSLGRTPPSESTPQFERMSQLGRTPPSESTAQFERMSQLGRTPPSESTAQFERMSQLGRTPPSESTAQFERMSQLGRTPPSESTSQFERMSQLGRTPPSESTSQFERMSQLGRTPPYESTSQFGVTPPNERVFQLERLPSFASTSQYERTPPYERDIHHELSSIFDHSFDARLDAEAKDFIPLAMRLHRPIIGRKFLDYKPKCKRDEIENIPQNTEQKSYELFPSGNSFFEFSTPVRSTLTSNLSNISPEFSPTISTPRVPEFVLSNPSTSTDIMPSKICTFCKKNGERPNVYTTHRVKEKIGRKYIVTCPILRRHVCETCGATQDDAHTITYCPILRVNNNGRPLQSTTITLKNTRIKSSGKRRY